MKLLLLTCLCFPACFGFAQPYVGAAIGGGLCKGYNAKSRTETFGMKSYVLLVPFGWNFNKILLECEPAFSGPITLDVKAGVKIDVSENIGIHLLAGIADDICLDLRPPPLQVTHLFYPAATVRIWLGKFMIQDSYINKTHLVGVGFIGFTRD